MSQSVPNPENVARFVLDNGLVVLVRENPSAPVAVLEGYLPAGAIHDPADKVGLCSFVAAMVTRGSAHYDYATFNETIEAIGANLTVAADTHVTSFNITSLSEDFPTMVQVLADVLRRPTFPQEHVERVRRQKLVRIQERDQDTQSVAILRFYEAIYGDHPYGRSVSGYTETVSAIRREDLEAFHQARYTPQGAILAVSGHVQAGAVLDLLAQHLGDWQGPAPAQDVPPPPPRESAQRLDYPMPGKYQADIIVGCQAVSRQHPDYYAVRVANTVLGQFGMMGRLGEEIREEQGLAYYAYSTLDAERAGGVWLASAGVNPANVERAVAAIEEQFRRLAEEPVGEDELADSQAYMTGVLPLTLETNEGVASTLLNMEWYGLGLDYLLRYNDLIYGVTPEDVQRVARLYLRPDRAVTVVAGPPGDG